MLLKYYTKGGWVSKGIDGSGNGNIIESHGLDNGLNSAQFHNGLKATHKAISFHNKQVNNTDQHCTCWHSEAKHQMGTKNRLHL